MKTKTRVRRLRRFEMLESRRLLTASVMVIDEDLLIEGDAEGPIAIVDMADGTLQVTQGTPDGPLVEIVDGVNDDIRIKLDTAGGAIDDMVTIDLSAQSVNVDRIYALLGNGNNSLSLIGGAISGNLQVFSGNGNDVVEVAEGAVVGRDAYVMLGSDFGCVVHGDYCLKLQAA